MQLRLVLFSLHQEIQIRKVPNYFFFDPSPLLVRSATFFFFFSSSLKSLPNPKHFSTFLPDSLPVVPLCCYSRALRTILLLQFCSPRIPRAPSSGRDQTNPAISAASSVT